MKPAIFDTNIIIDWLNDYEKAHSLLIHYEDPMISVITWMEAMVGIKTAQRQSETRMVLEAFTRIELMPPIIEKAVAISRDKGLKLWDAIIWATAIYEDALLVTRNTKDFPATDPRILIPYRL